MVSDPAKKKAGAKAERGRKREEIAAKAPVSTSARTAATRSTALPADAAPVDDAVETSVESTEIEAESTTAE
mgnify:CR=1 FL=1